MLMKVPFRGVNSCSAFFIATSAFAAYDWLLSGVTRCVGKVARLVKADVDFTFKGADDTDRSLLATKLVGRVMP